MGTGGSRLLKNSREWRLSPVRSVKIVNFRTMKVHRKIREKMKKIQIKIQIKIKILVKAVKKKQ